MRVFATPKDTAKMIRKKNAKNTCVGNWCIVIFLALTEHNKKKGLRLLNTPSTLLKITLTYTITSSAEFSCSKLISLDLKITSIKYFYNEK